MSDLTGGNLGPYRIMEQLGLGGMATVYRGYQPSMDRYVAIKVLPRHFAADPTFAGRFEQEARTIANLEHARILPVYDYGKQDDVTYIVMRYLDAGTLSDLIARGPIDLDEASRIVGQVAEGLDYAHSRGVIHRDMKPANIMLDSSGDVYVTDFGIAKLVAGDAQFTGSGIIGTPAYVSPEQGLGKTLDHRSDIYALGVVLYEMVTGRQPYEAETPMAVVLKHINEPLPLPRVVMPGLPLGVERVILRALAKDPDDRYDSCGEMAADLRTAVADLSEVVAELGDASRRPTQPPEATQPVVMPVDPGAETVESPFDDQRTLPVDAPVAPPAEKKGPSGLLVVGGAILGALLLAAIGALVLGALRGRFRAAPAPENPPVSDSASGEDQGGDETADSGAPAEDSTPAADRPASPAGDRELSCAPGDTERFYTDFSGGSAGLNDLPPDAEIIEDDDGQSWLRVAADESFNASAGANVRNGTLSMVVTVPPDAPDTIVAALMRVSDAGQYAALFNAGGRVTLTRSSELVEAGDGVPLTDGAAHLLQIHAIGGAVAVSVDGQLALVYSDREPLPGGAAGVGVSDGEALVSAIQYCEATSFVADATPVYIEDFESAPLDDSVWVWLNEPVGRWEIQDGRLRMPVVAGSSLSPDPASQPPILTLANPPQAAGEGVVQTQVTITPTENFQGAGLVVMGSDRRPLVSLLRAYCDVPNICAGDAIYFDHLSEAAQSSGGYRPHVAGAGELPANGPVTLRLARVRNVLIGLYRVGDGRWVEVGAWPMFDRQFGAIGIVTSAGGRPVAEIDAYFDNFALLRVNP